MLCLPGPWTLLLEPFPQWRPLMDDSLPYSAPSIPGDTTPSTGSAGTGASHPALCGPRQPPASRDLEALGAGPWPGPGSGASESQSWAEWPSWSVLGRWEQLEYRGEPRARLENRPLGDAVYWFNRSPACALPLLASLGSACLRPAQPRDQPIVSLGAERDAVDPAGGARQLWSLHLSGLQH